MPDKNVKASKELTEEELDKVSGGRPLPPYLAEQLKKDKTFDPQKLQGEPPKP